MSSLQPAGESFAYSVRLRPETRLADMITSSSNIEHLNLNQTRSVRLLFK